MQIADAIGSIGTKLEEGQVFQSGIDGQSAPYRDDAGNLQVDLRSNYSETGRAYNRAAMQGFAARSALDIRKAAQALSTEHTGDVKAFESAWHGFKNQFLSNAPKEMRGVVSGLLDEEGQQFALGVSEQRRKRDIQVAKGDMEATKQMYMDDLFTLARSGGVNTEQYKSTSGKLVSLLDELATNPDFAYSAKQAEIEKRRVESAAIGYSLVGNVDDLVGAGNTAGALKLIDRVRTDTSLTLSLPERNQLAGMMRERITAQKAIWDEEAKPFLAKGKDLTDQFKAGYGYDSPDYAAVYQGLWQTGKFSEAAKLANDRDMYRDQYARKSANTPTGSLVSYTGNLMRPNLDASSGRKLGQSGPSEARAFLLARSNKDASHVDGMDAGFGNKLASLIQAAPPGIAEKLGIYSGARSVERQTELWNDALKKYGSVAEARKWVAPPPGVAGSKGSNHNHGTAADLSYNGQSLKNAPPEVVDWLHSHAKDFGLKFPLSNENWHIEDDSTRRGASSGPTPAWVRDPDYVKGLRDAVTDRYELHFDDFKQMFTKGNIPSLDEIQTLADAIPQFTSDSLRLKYSEVLRGAEFLQNLELQYPDKSDRDAVITAIEAGMQSDGATIAQHQAVQSYREAETAQAKALKDDPIGYGASRYSQSVGALSGFPSGNDPDAINAAVASRQRAGMALVSAGEISSPPSVFRPSDFNALGQIWRSDDPAALNSLTSSLLQMPSDTFEATLEDPKYKDIISGAAVSVDPNKHMAAMQQLQTLSEHVGIGAVERTYSKDIVDRLQDWQARVRYYGPEEAKDWLKQRNDPKWQERVRPLVTAGEKEARKASVNDLTGQIGNAWFTNPDAPTDALTQRMMLNDYVTLVGERNGALNDIGKAKEQAVIRMREKWSASAAVNGRVMLYAPESFYPDVNGSKDWMSDQLSEFASARGMDIDRLSLVSDTKTEGEIQNKQLPGYLVAKVDPETGFEDILTDDDGNIVRVFFDPDRAASLARDKLIQQRKYAKDVSDRTNALFEQMNRMPEDATR
ncbi:hypothetical protein CQZ93_19560 [Ochrobactrum vermis]|nr:hypothetical protein CQZ93_19560 [Ochrobactrum vermis]